ERSSGRSAGAGIRYRRHVARESGTVGSGDPGSATLVQAETDFYADLDGHGLAIFAGRVEAPGFDRFDGSLVQSHSRGTHDAHVMGQAFWSDDHSQRHCALKFALARCLRILWLLGIYD